MNKDTFLERLSTSLKELKVDDRWSFLEEYETKINNLSNDAVIEDELGYPEVVARKIYKKEGI